MQKQIYWTGKSERNCFNCVHSVKNRAAHNYPYEPDEPAFAECDNLEVDEEIQEKYGEEEAPKHCGHYEPVMVIDSCIHCGNKIESIPEYEHPFWFVYNEAHPCCTQECADAEDKKMREENML